MVKRFHQAGAVLIPMHDGIELAYEMHIHQADPEEFSMFQFPLYGKGRKTA